MDTKSQMGGKQQHQWCETMVRMPRQNWSVAHAFDVNPEHGNVTNVDTKLHSVLLWSLKPHAWFYRGNEFECACSVLQCVHIFLQVTKQNYTCIPACVYAWAWLSCRHCGMFMRCCMQGTEPWRGLVSAYQKRVPGDLLLSLSCCCIVHSQLPSLPSQPMMIMLRLGFPSEQPFNLKTVNRECNHFAAV